MSGNVRNHLRQFVLPTVTNHRSYQTLKIITSVALISAAARSPGFNRSSFAASAVMIDVICCSPIARVTCASNPLNLIATTRPINWFRPLIFRKTQRRDCSHVDSEAANGAPFSLIGGIPFRAAAFPNTSSTLLGETGPARTRIPAGECLCTYRPSFFSPCWWHC